MFLICWGYLRLDVLKKECIEKLSLRSKNLKPQYTSISRAFFPLLIHILYKCGIKSNKCPWFDTYVLGTRSLNLYNLIRTSVSITYCIPIWFLCSGHSEVRIFMWRRKIQLGYHFCLFTMLRTMIKHNIYT